MQQKETCLYSCIYSRVSIFSPPRNSLSRSDRLCAYTASSARDARFYSSPFLCEATASVLVFITRVGKFSMRASEGMEESSFYTAALRERSRDKNIRAHVGEYGNRSKTIFYISFFFYKAKQIMKTIHIIHRILTAYTKNFAQPPTASWSDRPK